MAKRRTHEWIDQRSLAMDRAIVHKLRTRPELVEVARANLLRWSKQRQGVLPAALEEWRAILSTWPLDRIIEDLLSDCPESRRRRQSSPFCGILTPDERAAILQEFEAQLREEQR